MSFVTNKEEFDLISSFHARVVRRKERLPRQVFLLPAATYRFIEFGRINSPEAWALLCDLSVSALDDSFSMICEEPDPVDYYHANFELFAGLSYPISSSYDEFLDDLNVIPDNSIADALIHRMDVFSCTSPAGKWAGWGERSLDVVVVALAQSLEGVLERHGTLFVHAADALRGLIAASFRGGNVPAAFELEFDRNYGAIS
ncbi:MAG TPA: hypothetical protein VFE23_01095 [Usitatibacter sp.]|jgi:hypothetical protein|nr:hypothetical protein [Usitatibacter sp.]